MARKKAATGRNDFNFEAIGKAVAEVNRPRGAGYVRGQADKYQARHYLTTKKGKAEQAKAKKIIKEGKSGGKGGDSSILGDIGSAVGSALEAVDVPRSVIQSTLADTVDAAASGDIGDVAGTLNPVNLLRKTAVGVGKATGVDVGGANDLYYKKQHAKDLIEHTGAGTYLQRAIKEAGLQDTWLNNSWVKRGIGFAGDVASDPLSYVGPAHVLEGGYKALATKALHAPEEALLAGERAARTGVSDATRSAAEETIKKIAARAKDPARTAAQKAADSALEGRARRLLAQTHNAKALEQRGVGAQAHNAAMKEGARLATKITSKRSVSGLSKEEMQRIFDTTSGVKVTLPGTGRVAGRITGASPKQFTVLPKGVTDVLGTPIRGGKNALANSKLGIAVGDKLSGENGKIINSMLRSGDKKKVAAALEIEQASRTASSKAEAGLRLNPDATINGEKLNAHAHFGKGQAQGLGPRAMDVYTHKIKPLLKGQDFNKVLQGVETGQIEGPAAQAIKDFMHELRNAAEANGVPIAQRENYFPRWLTEEAKQARGAAGDFSKGGKITAERARANEVIAEARNAANPGAAPIAATDEHAIRNAVEDWARVHLPDLPNGYYESNPDKILPHYVEALTTRIKTQDIVTRLQERGIVVPDWIEKGGTLTKKAQAEADRLLKEADKLKAQGDTADDAAKEAANHAKLMNTLADTTEAEAKTQAQRQAAAESDAAFATMGGNSIMPSGAADSSTPGALGNLPPGTPLKPDGTPDWEKMDASQIDAIIGSPIGRNKDGSIGEAVPGSMDVQQTAAEQAQQDALDQAIARGDVVNPEAQARMEQAGLPPEVIAAAAAAENAVGPKKAEAMQAFMDVLDKHGIDATQAREALAQHNVETGVVDQGVSDAAGGVVKNRFGQVQNVAPGATSDYNATAEELTQRLRDMAPGQGGTPPTPEELQQYRENFMAAYDGPRESGLGVKSKGGRLSKAEKARREAAKLNGAQQKMDAVVESMGGPSAENQRLQDVYRGLRRQSGSQTGFKDLKARASADPLGDLTNPMDAGGTPAAQAVEAAAPPGAKPVIESPAEKARREELAKLGPDSGQMQKPIKPGFTRIYRGEQDIAQSNGTQFTESLAEAKQHAGEHGTIYEVDVPTSHIAGYRAKAAANADNGANMSTLEVPASVRGRATASLHSGAAPIDITGNPGDTIDSVLAEITGAKAPAGPADSTTSVQAFDNGHPDAMYAAQEAHRKATGRANRLTRQIKKTTTADTRYAEATRLEQKYPEVRWNQEKQRFDARTPRETLEAANFKEARRGKAAVDATVPADPAAPVNDLVAGQATEGPDYSREAADLAQYRADAQAGRNDPIINAKLQGNDPTTVHHEAVAAQDVLKTRQAAVQGAIDAGAPDHVITEALSNLAADVASATQRVADGIAPLRHASAHSGAEVIEPVTATTKDAARDNVLGDLYRSQRTPSAQATADEATGVYTADANALTQFERDASAGIADPNGTNAALDAIDQGKAPVAGPASPPPPPPGGPFNPNDHFHNDAQAGIDSGAGQGTPGYTGPVPPAPPGEPPRFPPLGGPAVPPPPPDPATLHQMRVQVGAAAESADFDRRSFVAGMEDARAKIKQLGDRGYDTSVHEKRLAIYEQALKEADPMRARALQFQADALSAQSQADKLWTQASLARVNGERLKTPRTVGAFTSEINKSMARLRVDPTLAAPNDIADILNGLSKVNTPEGVRKFLKHYDQALNYIKAWQIATPGFHLRNFMGGMFNNYLAGVDINSYSRFWRDRHAFLNGTLTSGPRYDAMKELLPHVGSAQYSAFEVGGLETRTLAQKFNPLSKNNLWLTKNRQAGGAVEEMLRGALGYDRLLKGKNIDEAVSDIMRYHFDYQDLSRFEKQGVKRVIPFYTWTRHNLPLQMEMYVQAPGKYARYWQAKKEIEMGQHPEGVVPSYFLNEGFGIHSPFNFGGGDVYITPDLPFTTTVQQALPDLSGVNPGSPGTYLSALDGYASMATPILKTPVERMMNRQFFKGIPFQDKAADMPTAWKAVPGLEAALSTVGLAKNGKITDRDAYTIEQYLPMLGRMRRLGGGAKKDNERIVSSWMSFMGLPLKTNTPYEQQLERFRRKLHTGGPKQNPYARKTRNG